MTPLWEVGPGIADWKIRSPNAVALNPRTGLLAIADHSTESITFLDSLGRVTATTDLRPRNAPGGSIPEAMAWQTDGRLGVYDPLQSSLYLVTSQGTLDVDRRLPALRGKVEAGSGVQLVGSNVLIEQMTVKASDSTTADDPVERYFHVLRASLSQGTVDTLATARAMVSASDGRTPIPGATIPVAAPIGDSAVAIAGDIPELRIRVIDSAGRTVREICRDAPALPFTAEELRLATEIGMSVPMDSAARVGRLFSGTDGRIWAQRNRRVGERLADRHFGPPDATFDVFALDGGYLGEVVAPPDTRLFAAHGDVVMGFRYRDEGVSVAAWRMGDAADAPQQQAPRPSGPAAVRAFDAPGLEWRVVDLPERALRLYIERGSAADAESGAVVDSVTRAQADVLALLGEPSPSRNDSAGALFLLGSRDAMRRISGRPIAGFVQPGEATAFFVWDRGYRAPLRHELAHLYTFERWGRPGGGDAAAWLVEGIGGWAGGSCQGHSSGALAAGALARGALPTVATLGDSFRALPEDVAVPAAGSLVQFLHARDGIAGLRARWRANARAALPDSATEGAWRAHVASVQPARLDIARLMREGC